MNGSDAGLVATTVLIVAAIRKHYPKLDGLVVLAVVLVVAGGVVLTAGPHDGLATFVRHVGIVFLLAIGANAWATKLAERAGPTALGPAIEMAGTVLQTNTIMSAETTPVVQGIPTPKDEPAKGGGT